MNNDLPSSAGTLIKRVLRLLEAAPHAKVQCCTLPFGGGSTWDLSGIAWLSNMTQRAPLAIVVDDDPMILMAAVEIVAEAGFNPLEAMTVEAAIAVLEQHSAEVRVLFTDVQMPGDRDGFSLARETASRWPHIQIVVASGLMKPGPGDLPEGATFISKPFSAEIVHERLREVLPEQEQPDPLKQ